MCSIIGYYGSGRAAAILVRGLEKMEYRGYDSVGVATKTDSGLVLRKGVGNVDKVNKTIQLDKMSGSVGIGHTRWATHGGVTDANAHPHPSNSGKIAVVHNGMIDNFSELKDGLVKDGFSFSSETDTEVIANQLQKNYAESPGIKEALIKTLSQLKGDYGFVAMFGDGTLAAARLHMPLVIGVGNNACFLSSDILGFIEQTDEVIYMDNGNFVIIDSRGPQIYDFGGAPVEKQITKVSKELVNTYKEEYAHFTLKEISEQPDTVLRVGENCGDVIGQMVDQIRGAGSVYITGSGTSYNSALMAQYLMSKYAKVSSYPIIASEFPYAPISIGEGSVLIAVSQSGESADVIKAVDIARRAGARVFSIVNLPMSSLSRESSLVLGINCGPEIGVAATKSFTSQLGIIYRITEMLCGGRMGTDFGRISRSISRILENHAEIQRIAGELRDISDIYVLGRGMHYPIAAEAALKIKELTYVHAEGIPGGELKHGPLALMGSNTHCMIVNPDDSTYDDMLIGAREIKARGAKIIGISDRKSDLYDYWIEIPRIGEPMYPIIEIVPIQLLSYYLALEKDADPDYPKNLAKSVTVR